MTNNKNWPDMVYEDAIKVLDALSIGHQAQSILAKHYLLINPDGENAKDYTTGRIEIQQAIAIFKTFMEKVK